MQRILILLVVSLVVFQARPGATGAVLVAAAAGLAASAALPRREMALLHPLRMLRFIPWFLVHSFLGGLDVAQRAFRGSSALRPGVVRYRTRIRQPVVRVIFANTVSLMPGTLTARLRDDTLWVHVLDEDTDVAGKLAQVEGAVRRAFGEGDG
jgi:multicomponent Na+:H+ antiporter subunit E